MPGSETNIALIKFDFAIKKSFFIKIL